MSPLSPFSLVSSAYASEISPFGLLVAYPNTLTLFECAGDPFFVFSIL
ncbi:hypothetical protein HMPREF3293_00101 [Christensenella minuta]|uniref:Uncharacterized protein n=1 Tax=Christensenella minuta TaxID=626937 RepID=A0A136Q8V1_9FIRM|nr:hypothetical protein HMPREF3293_00101 [Christensenella minuta]